MSSEPATLSAKEGRGLYRALVLRKQLMLAGLALALLLSLCVDLALGPASYSLDQVV
ncbi:MAG: iron ABC transporter permease, partial [Mesorhizobium sp.]